MACDVGQYLPGDDQPIPDIERVIHLNHTALPPRTRARRRRGPALRPRGALELLVITEEGQQLTLVAYLRKGSGLFVELHKGDEKWRSLHSHYGHCNPGSHDEIPDGHMHFPTEKYPLIGGEKTYAYGIECPDLDTPEEFVQLFCAILNVNLDALQLQLGTSGRW